MTTSITAKKLMAMAMGSSSSAMDMATSTAMDMASSTSSMDMSSTTSSTMDMSSSTMSMHMYLTRDYLNYPVLFKNFSASTKAQAFGIFVFLFVMAFIARGFEYIKLYLENVTWNENRAVEGISGISSNEKGEAITAAAATGASSSGNSSSSLDGFEANHFAQNMVDEPAQRTGASMASSVFRDIILMVLCFLPDMFGYALMLVAMTYTLTYFFAVVTGSAVGRFVFEKLARRHNINSSTVFGKHC